MRVYIKLQAECSNCEATIDVRVEAPKSLDTYPLGKNVNLWSYGWDERGCPHCAPEQMDDFQRGNWADLVAENGGTLIEYG